MVTSTRTSTPFSVRVWLKSWMPAMPAARSAKSAKVSDSGSRFRPVRLLSLIFSTEEPPVSVHGVGSSVVASGAPMVAELVNAQEPAIGVTTIVPVSAKAPVTQNRTVQLAAVELTRIGARLPSSTAVPRPVPLSTNSGARSSSDSRSMVLPPAAVKVTSIQVRQPRLLMTLMSTFAPAPGSATVAVAPVTVKATTLARLPAPVVVTPLTVTSAFLIALAAKLTVTVPTVHLSSVRPPTA